MIFHRLRTVKRQFIDICSIYCRTIYTAQVESSPLEIYRKKIQLHEVCLRKTSCFHFWNENFPSVEERPPTRTTCSSAQQTLLRFTKLRAENSTSSNSNRFQRKKVFPEENIEHFSGARRFRRSTKIFVHSRRRWMWKSKREIELFFRRNFLEIFLRRSFSDAEKRIVTFD